MATGQELYKRVKDELERLIEFVEPWHSTILTIYIMQTYLKDVLNSVFYVGVVGPKGSGKTTVLQVTTGLSRNGLLTGNASVAALARILDGGADLAVDEIDELQGDILQLTQAALRQGYRRGSYYLRWDVTTNSEERIKTFGPKIMSFRSGIEDALQSRTFLIGMAPAEKQAMSMVLDNMVWDSTNQPLKIDLINWANEELKKKWDQARVEAVLKEQRFIEQLDFLLGPIRTPREIEIAASMLVVSLIVGVDIRKEITSATKSQRDMEVDDEKITLKEYIISEWNGHGKPELLELETIRAAINYARREQKERPYSPYHLRRMLREIGFRDNKELVRITRGGPREKGRAALKLTSLEVEKFLTNDPESLTDFRKSLTGKVKSLTDFPSSSPSSEGVRASVRELEEEVRKFLSTGEPLYAPGEKVEGLSEGFTESDLRAIGAKLGLQPTSANNQFDAWKKNGLIYEPKAGSGRWKFV